MDTPAILYTRELPGGGFVTIEGQPAGAETYRGVLWVERRTDPGRRLGHIPPVVVEAAGATQGNVFKQLLEIANSNVAVASAIRRWQIQRQAGRLES